MPSTAVAISPKMFGHPVPAGTWVEENGSVHSADLLVALGSVATFSRNAEIFSEDALADHIYVLLSGTVRVCKLLGDGRRQIANFCLAGDVFGWEMGARHRFSAEAVGECKVVRVKRSILFARAADDADLAQALWAVTAGELARAQNHLLVLGRKTAQERVASFLLDMAERMSGSVVSGRAQEVQLPMSRQDIADYLGLTIETVSRTLTHLEDVEAIALPSSRRIVLRNCSALRGLNV
ncbi:helix-turn-helix domain-containing protein [Xanthobacter sp. TB0136]|uniref:helix-turn-helix domain-containing protein n=1 Tax=Xanthobacter sp. TB0136 TaxID=3459177 RepID=UPI004038FF92